LLLAEVLQLDSFFDFWLRCVTFLPPLDRKSKITVFGLLEQTVDTE
jgi:hypothetical protein